MMNLFIGIGLKYGLKLDKILFDANNVCIVHRFNKKASPAYSGHVLLKFRFFLSFGF